MFLSDNIGVILLVKWNIMVYYLKVSNMKFFEKL